MDNKNTIREELQALCPAVANLDRTNLYTVPEGYFEKLGENIIQFIKENEEPVLKFSSAMPFKVPHGYFDGLADRVLQKAKQQSSNNEVWDELNSVAPLLNTISKVPVFSVPDNYFDTLTIRTTEAKPAKVVRLSSINRVIRYAVAAIIIGIIAISGILFFSKDESPIEISYNPEEIKKLSDQEIIEYLNTTSFADAGITNSAELQQESEDYESFLQSLSEQEIEEYLKENPEPIEIHPKEG